MNWTLWWVFVPANTILCLVPGPAVLLVLSTSLRLGWRKSLASNSGILFANTLYYAVSMTGLGALLAASYTLFAWVKWLGVAYLVWLGLREILAEEGTPRADAIAKESTAFGLFRQATFTQLSNPKAILFFSAFFPQFLDTRFPVPRQVVILAITGLITEFAVLGGYGIFGSAAGDLARSPKFRRWTNRIAGTLLLCAAIGLGFLR